MFYTYILISKTDKKTYTGHTANVTKRFNEHNEGFVRSSKKYSPYEILKVEEFSTLQEAKTRELYYKNYRGRQKIKSLIEKRNSF